MKNIVSLAFASLIALSSSHVISDDHAGNGPYYAFYDFNVTNPAAVVAAMDDFWASECGKKYPADVVPIGQILFGSFTTTIGAIF